MTTPTKRDELYTCVGRCVFMRESSIRHGSLFLLESFLTSLARANACCSSAQSQMTKALRLLYHLVRVCACFVGVYRVITSRGCRSIAREKLRRSVTVGLLRRHRESKITVATCVWQPPSFSAACGELRHHVIPSFSTPPPCNLINMSKWGCTCRLRGHYSKVESVLV